MQRTSLKIHPYTQLILHITFKSDIVSSSLVVVDVLFIKCPVQINIHVDVALDVKHVR